MQGRGGPPHRGKNLGACADGRLGAFHQQIYTQVSIRRLKAVHALTHPGAKITALIPWGQSSHSSGSIQ
jgi:hypothetical protein